MLTPETYWRGLVRRRQGKCAFLKSSSLQVIFLASESHPPRTQSLKRAPRLVTKFSIYMKCLITVGAGDRQ